MIDYNKYVKPVSKSASVDFTIQKNTHKRKIKISKENKKYLKLIGLLK